MNDMRSGVSAYVKTLRDLGAKKIGIYVGHHLYKTFDLNLEEADTVWIPHYGRNDGTLNSTPNYPCDIHQYTDKGGLNGYNSFLDLNRLMRTKPLSFFTGSEEKDLDTIKMNLHGKEMEAKGIWKENINYILVRFLEKLGYKVDWKDNKVMIQYKGEEN